jgi:hypothetical protein
MKIVRIYFIQNVSIEARALAMIQGCHMDRTVTIDRKVLEIFNNKD